MSTALSSEAIDAAVAAYVSGDSAKAIAVRLGVDGKTVLLALRRRGVEIRKRVATYATADERVRAWQSRNRSRYNKNQSNGRRARVARGLCSFCVQPLANIHVRYCTMHWVASMMHKHGGKGDTTKAAALLQKLHEQQHKCPYSGRDLVMGVNCSLDHVNPKSRFPEQSENVENLQWVDSQVNRMKNDMTHDEFLSLCKQIWMMSESTHEEPPLPGRQKTAGKGRGTVKP